MSNGEKKHDDPTVVAFSEAITKQIDYFRQEFDITYASVIGVLTMQAMDMWAEARDIEPSDD